MQDSPHWPPTRQSPVIALLDTGIQREHPWLPAGGQPSFVLNAEDYGWQSPLRDDDTELDPDYGSHWGHATFIAGLIRLAAPAAQVLSMRIMDNNGKVRESHAADALSWLAYNPGSAGGIDIDVVLMAFGRQDEADDQDLDELRSPISKLCQRGVRIVASAGNDGAERPVYPAAFATDPGLSVLSVGALATPVTRAPYSNYGPWVTQWRKGTNAISIMPLTTKSPDSPGPGFDNAATPAYGDGYAWWSGTSFAAAIAAGQLAAEMPVSQALPETAVGS
jgi:subtilisin family serine protease